MKLTNIKYYSTALLLATTIGITSCGYKQPTKVINTETTSKDIENSDIEEGLEELNIDDEFNTIIKDFNLHFKSFIVLHYHRDSGIITIHGSWEKIKVPELTEELYDKINKILEQPSVKGLELYCLENEIDFSKLNLSNIKDITLSCCKENFDYEPFKNQKFKNIMFESIPVQHATEIVANGTTPVTNINYIDLDNGDETSNFIKYLVDNQVKFNDLYISTIKCDSKDFTMLSKVKASDIEIMLDSSANQVFNLELYPNENIKGFHIWHIGDNINLGDIQVTTNHSSFYFTFNGLYSTITENTNFNLPNNSNVSISAKYDSGYALQDLSNTNSFNFYDYNKDDAIYYNSITDNFEDVIIDYTNNKQIQKELQK